MEKHTQNFVLGAFVFVVSLIGVGTIWGGKRAISNAPQMEFDSKRALNDFLVESQARNYTKAHQLLSRNLSSSLSAPTLLQQWSSFELSHGAIKNWTTAPSNSGYKNVVNLWPRSVESTYKVTGKRSGAGYVTVKLVAEQGKWRIDKLDIRP